MIKTKHIRDKPVRSDGRRVFVDRKWPHHINKKNMMIHVWLKNIAPSTKLMTWFSHDMSRWHGFREKYKEELLHRKKEINKFIHFQENGNVTLLYDAKDKKHNNAVVLREFLEELL